MNQGVMHSFMKVLADEAEVHKTTIKVEPEKFKVILDKIDDALVIIGKDGLLAKKSVYMTYYKGFYILCKTFKELQLPDSVEIISAQKIWLY